MKEKILILYSGGLDSYILFHWTKITYPDSEIKCIYYDYGNPICETEKKFLPEFVEVRSIDWFKNSTESLVGKIGESHKGNIYIPGRNLVFSILSACQELPDYIFMGGLYEECHVNATDKNITFIEKTSDILNYVLQPFKEKIQIKFPFVDSKMTKLDIMKWAIDSGITIDELEQKTISCFKQNDFYMPCGECHSCMRTFSFFQHWNHDVKFLHHPFLESDFGRTYILNSITQLENSNYNKYLLYDIDYESIAEYLKKNKENLSWVTDNVLDKLTTIVHEKQSAEL
jgi:7-cyano-7-deazaguanine synthase in queuosine biosynthesis